MDKRSRFSLSAEIHFRYFLHSIILVCLCMLISTIILGKKSALFGFLIAGIASYILCGCARGVVAFYTHNKSGAEKIVRVMLPHRDVVTWDASVAFQWRAAKRACRYAYVIPIYILAITITMSCCFFFHEAGLWFVGLPVLIIGLLLSKIPIAYADLHICDPEVGKMYRDPESYSRAIEYIKQEQHQQQQDAIIQAELDKERARRQGLPPDDSQYKRPKKPY